MSDVPAAADASAALENDADDRENDREVSSSAVFKGIRRTLKVLLFIFVLYYLVLPQIGGLRSATHEIIKVNPVLLVIGVAFEASALVAYSFMTRACLPRGAIPMNRLLRIQLSTKAVSNTATTFGWDKRAMACASRCRRSSKSSVAERRTFSATLRSSLLSYTA